jgi:hypothetical protein
MLVFGFRRLDPTLGIWVGSTALLALAAYTATARVRRRRDSRRGESV